MIKDLKIGTKLTLSMTTLIVVVIITLSLAIAMRVRQMSLNNAQEVARETVYHYAHLVKSELDVALDETRALARLLESSINVEELTLTRRQVNLMLKYFIEHNLKFLAIYVGFEPNAFDGKDQNFAGEWGHDKTGRFLPYWTRNEPGEGVVEPMLYYEEAGGLGDYYQLPKKRKKETIIDPYPVQGKKRLITSLVVPLLNKRDEFMGIAGVDIDFKPLQENISRLQIANYRETFTTLYTSEGRVIATKNLAFLGKYVGETSDNPEFVENVLENKPFFMTRDSKIAGQLVFTYGTPIEIGYTGTFWMVTVDIPVSELGLESQETMLLIITIGLAALLLGILVIYLLARNISKPLHQLVNLSQAIAGGHLTNDIRWSGQDEIGQLLQAFAQMQTQLRERLLEEQRVADEALRINQALYNANTSVLITDNNYRIIYLNQAAQQLFREKQNIFRQHFPTFEANQLLGSSIDKFHQHPNYQRELLEQLNSTHSGTINIGRLNWSIKVTPVRNAEDQRLGWIVEFVDRTAEIATEQEVSAVMAAATLGDFKQRINLNDKTGFFKTFSQHLNKTLDYTQQMIDELRRVFEALARGDLSQNVTNNYTGSLELLKNDVNATVNTLTQVINTVKQSAEVVSHDAEEISQGNTNLNYRTEQQAASLEETAASMEEMTSTVQQNSDHAQQAKFLAEQARSYAVQGGEAVSAVIKAMTEINHSSKKMSEILAVINDIAFQTNLLALNAAVEAARAGEQGRGFAVVAGEVRNLAQRSAEAAKEIKRLIESSIAEVEEGTRLVNQSGKTLQDIMEAVKKVSDIIADIATASLEQTAGLQQVNNVIIQLDEVTQQNAALVEEASAASDSLKEQSQKLKEHVGFFKTEEIHYFPEHVKRRGR